MNVGTVFLMGAGPGDPDLITRKGLRLLRKADVVIYDRLVPRQLLDETRPNAELINAGKAPTRHRLSQAAINALIIDRALAGRDVLRLKGGDPFVFGRGGEEAIACHRCGIPVEVVPGVSSAFAVPAYAGIPLTQRRISSAFTVITGHEIADSVNYAALARLGGTIVILMGVKQLPKIADKLLLSGLAGDTPAAVIERGATARQRTVTGALESIAAVARERAIRPPAITVVGEVVRLRAEGLAWYDLLPQLADRA
ncbi:MAG: uroporphyrinogen-III C-methyltransferase [Chloroflexi bacterium]|nr:uroporphyrinogen-III C-methyltransferase [Chloroflexota bacterium]MCY4246727.1 uroporphyrinogen-III C-methyltransferase [Chloroflexota bacterium]